MQNRLKLAIQSKGRIGNSIPDFLRRAGLKFELFERQLVSKCTNFPLDLIFVRNRDIPVFVEDAAADLGIVGQDLLLERKNDVQEFLTLGFGQCTLCLAVPEDSKYKKPEDLRGLRIATSYAALTTVYFSKKLLPVDIISVQGSVEIGPRLRIAEAVVDLVGTGTTLEINRMRVIEEILQSQAVLIGNKTAVVKQQQLIDEIVFRFSSVVEASDKKLLIFNIPKKSLGKVRAFKNSSENITISDVNGGQKDLAAVRMVVCEERSWDIMKQISTSGATSIALLNIERLVANDSCFAKEIK